MTDTRPRELLVYAKTDTFGDALIKLPAIGALRRAFPDWHITWLAGRGRSLYAGDLSYAVQGLLDTVIDNAGIGNRWSQLLRRPLGGRYFDIIIDSQRYLTSTLILRRIRHGLFVSAAAGFRLSDRRPPADSPRPRRMLDQIMELVSLAARRTVEPVDGVRIPPELSARARELLPDGPVYVGLAPGAGQRDKCWPLERFIALARTQVQAARVPVFFLGPAELEWADPIRTAVPEARVPAVEPGVLDAGPLLTVALAQRVAASVSNDCGTGHMLAAGGRPLVSLFGPTPPEKFAPRARRLALVRAADYGEQRMEAIPQQAVRDALEGLLVP